MLDEAEWERMEPALSNHLDKIRRIREEQTCDIATAQRLAGQDACDLYYDMTGYRETNFNALWHHRLANFGSECPRCGHLFRTPKATFCANCGLKKNDAEKLSTSKGPITMEPSEAVLAAANEHVDQHPSEKLRSALNAIAGLPEVERSEAVTKIATGLPTIDNPSGAGILAVWLGAHVEKSGDPTKTAASVLETLLRWSRSIPEMPEDETPPELAPDLADGLEMLGRSMVAHLSRSKTLLTEIRGREDACAVLAKAEKWSPGPMWVMEILRQRSGELVVLHGQEWKGYRVVYQNISNCFHLFTLLQGALDGIMPGSRHASAQTLAIAKGEQLEECHDEAWWHYGQASSREPTLVTTVFGEGSPDSIEQHNGEQVLLLWPPLLQGRSWDGGFFSPTLEAAPPSVTIKCELSVEEVGEWRTRLGLPEAVRPRGKPWWKFW
jgi:uncharacterized Zn finger protein (UPF0148 family)